MFGCKHKFESIIKDGYQFCNKCGKAFPVKCNHKWKIYEKYSTHKFRSSEINNVIYIMMCAHCGDIKKEKIKSYE